MRRASLSNHLKTISNFRHDLARSRALAVLRLSCLAITLSGCGSIGSLVNSALPLARVKLAFSCIAEGTLVDTPSGPQRIERLEAGEWVTGYSGRPVRILQKHSYLENPATLFLRISFNDGAMVELCGMHRLAGIRSRNLKVEQIVADRTITGIGSRSGVTRSFDLLTEDAGYRIDGVPVNSMIEEMQAAAADGMTSVRD